MSEELTSLCAELRTIARWHARRGHGEDAAAANRAADLIEALTYLTRSVFSVDPYFGPGYVVYLGGAVDVDKPTANLIRSIVGLRAETQP